LRDEAIAELSEPAVAPWAEHPADAMPAADTARTVPVIVVDLQRLPCTAADGAQAALQGYQGVDLGRCEPVGLASQWGA
jgi:hypothetical protein